MLLVELIEIITKNEQTNSRRQVSVPPVRIDLGDLLAQGFSVRQSDMLKAFPELVFKADACLVTANSDGALSDRRHDFAFPRRAFGIHPLAYVECVPKWVRLRHWALCLYTSALDLLFTPPSQGLGVGPHRCPPGGPTPLPKLLTIPALFAGQR